MAMSDFGSRSVLFFTLVLVALVIAVWAWWRTYSVETDTVENIDIQDGAVTSSKIADGAVGMDQIDPGYLLNNARRYLFEDFLKIPVVVATFQAYAVGPLATALTTIATPSNLEFQQTVAASGTIATIARDASGQGITLNASTTSSNDATVDAGGIVSLNPWANTACAFDFETSFRIKTGIVTNSVVCGLRYDTGAALAYDFTSDVGTHAAFAAFAFDTYGAGAGTGLVFTDATKLHFIYSPGHASTAVTYVTRLPITVAADTEYKCRISMDSARKFSIWVNDVQYTITNNALAAGVDTTSAVTVKGTGKSLACVTGKSLYPYLGFTSAVVAQLYAVRYFRIATDTVPTV